MNIFVTVGTTPYNDLFQHLSFIENSSWHFDCQTADAEVSYANLTCFDYTPNWQSHIEKADLVITHAGAGSVYKLLEMGKKIMVIPNLERIDHHQLDLANYVEKNGYALVCRVLNDIEQVIAKAEQYAPTPYEKIDFFKGDEINEAIKESLM
jgi:beta-1,4-N-acetylglucosaminyltransferase